MLIRITKSNYSAQLALAILLALGLWIPNFFSDTSPQIADSPTFLYGLLFDWVQNHIILAKLIAFVCVILQAFMLTELVRTHSLSKNPMFVGLIYIVLMSAQSDWQIIQPFLISNFFVIGAFSYLFKIYDRKEPYEYVFNVTFLLALASLLTASFLPLAIVVFWIFLSYSINRWREWFIAIIGFAFPFFVLFLWASLTENMDVFSDFHIPLTAFDTFWRMPAIAVWMQIFIPIVFLLTLAGLGFSRFQAKFNEISQRKKNTAMMLGLLWTFGVTMVLSQSVFPLYLATLFVFSAFFIAEWFCQSRRKWLPELMLYVFILVAFGVQYL